jgi:hypothetical protein
MDLDRAMHAHLRFRPKMQIAIDNKQEVELTQLSQDGCELARWLANEAKTIHGNHPGLQELAEAHNSLHEETAVIAGYINAGDYDRAAKMLGLGTPFSKYSLRFTTAVSAFKESLQSALNAGRTSGSYHTVS